ncbi:hypothetical protein [Thermoplasma volcanium]|nr:hypothetical protein [Thermoplasma volcanium]
MEKDKANIEKCIYYNSGNCELSSYVTKCTLCLNYKSFYQIGKKKKLIYDIFDLEPEIAEISSGSQSKLF